MDGWPKGQPFWLVHRPPALCLNIDTEESSGN